MRFFYIVYLFSKKCRAEMYETFLPVRCYLVYRLFIALYLKGRTKLYIGLTLR